MDDKYVYTVVPVKDYKIISQDCVIFESMSYITCSLVPRLSNNCVGAHHLAIMREPGYKAT